jgi:hypothetical protein
MHLGQTRFILRQLPAPVLEFLRMLFKLGTGLLELNLAAFQFLIAGIKIAVAFLQVIVLPIEAKNVGLVVLDHTFEFEAVGGQAVFARLQVGLLVGQLTRQTVMAFLERTSVLIELPCLFLDLDALLIELNAALP